MSKQPERPTNWPMDLHLTTPRLGDPITADAQFSYVKRASSERQAKTWNEILADDPLHGPETGFRVGVAPIKDADGRYPLVWVTG